MYVHLLYLPLFNFAYLFFFSFLSSFLSTYLLVLFSLLYFPLGTLFQFCFPVCALVSFVLADRIFDFLSLPGKFIVLHFCWTVLILLMGIYLYGYIQSHFLLLLQTSVSMLGFCSSVEFSWFFSFFLSSSVFFFSLFYNFNFLKTYYILSMIIPLFAFLTVLFPLQLIFHVYKSSSSTSI